MLYLCAQQGAKKETGGRGKSEGFALFSVRVVLKRTSIVEKVYN